MHIHGREYRAAVNVQSSPNTTIESDGNINCRVQLRLTLPEPVISVHNNDYLQNLQCVIKSLVKYLYMYSKGLFYYPLNDWFVWVIFCGDQETSSQSK